MQAEKSTLGRITAGRGPPAKKAVAAITARVVDMLCAAFATSSDEHDETALCAAGYESLELDLTHSPAGVEDLLRRVQYTLCTSAVRYR